ncbi:MAG TPA: GMP/IMP nucleotidase [Gammaproteobacteria bacterium]|nr:GMP/IMP nucleotidase [Gammaproteobacteria bacterium]HIO17568.1 GMP/IMP nucleotidase [Gammaproteobacteria bacterium]
MLNWAHIDSVLLDLDGTLLDLHYDNYFWREFVPARYAQNRSLSLTDAKAKLLPRMLELQGTLEWYCVDFWSRELDLDILALKTELRHLIKLRPGARSFLSYLQTRPQRVILATNAHLKSVELKFQQTGLAPLFDRVITSHELGHPKEEQAFWRKLQLLEAFDPRRTLFIDDNLPVLEAAACYGIGHLLAVSRPDLTQPSRTLPGGLTGLDHFDDLLPPRIVPK